MIIIENRLYTRTWALGVEQVQVCIEALLGILPCGPVSMMSPLGSHTDLPSEDSVRWQIQQWGKCLRGGGRVFTFIKHLLPATPQVRNHTLIRAFM